MNTNAPESPLTTALRRFEATEANLVKLERLWDEIQELIPRGIQFGENPEYEDRCRSFNVVLKELPRIDGWKPDGQLLELDAIAQCRLDAQEIGEIESLVRIENLISEPGREIREYRYKFNQKRRELIRDALVDLIDSVDFDIRNIRSDLNSGWKNNKPISGKHWDALQDHIDQIDTLLGSSVDRPSRWIDIRRHLYFGQVGDFDDIENIDWPSIKEDLRKGLYGANEPVPVDVSDLSEITQAKPRGEVTTKLEWDRLSPEDFERLIFTLISNEPNYENPEWLMRTNAPDRGRDLSAHRIIVDPLSGTIRARVIIQCRHWLEHSVSVSDISTLREQMKLWEPPRVDVHVIATSGRFTSDAVAAIEKHNQSDSALRIEMWPESHLERLLASRPAIIAEFHLR